MGFRTTFTLALATRLNLLHSEKSSDYKGSIVRRVRLATFSLDLQSFLAYEEPNQLTFFQRSTSARLLRKSYSSS